MGKGQPVFIYNEKISNRHLLDFLPMANYSNLGISKTFMGPGALRGPNNMHFQ
jgi:hypothetical protein